jgi:anti-anti-sigma factor
LADRACGRRWVAGALILGSMTINPSHNGEDANPAAAFRVGDPAERGGTVVVAIEGEFDLGAVPEFEAAMARLPAGARLVVDMRELGYIDSTGISSLLRLDARLREAGGTLACVVPPEGTVRRVFDLIRLGETLSVCEEPPGE